MYVCMSIEVLIRSLDRSIVLMLGFRLTPTGLPLRCRCEKLLMSKKSQKIDSSNFICSRPFLTFSRLFR